MNKYFLKLVFIYLYKNEYKTTHNQYFVFLIKKLQKSIKKMKYLIINILKKSKN